MNQTTRTRTPQSIQTSYHIVEFVLAAVERERSIGQASAPPCTTFPIQVAKAWDAARIAIAASLAQRCPHVIQLWEPDTASHPYCAIDYRQYAEVLPTREYSTNPLKRLDCPDRIQEVNPWENVLVTFGKFDTMIVAELANLYWCNQFRMQIAEQPSFQQFLSFPTCRIKHTWLEAPEFVQDLKRVQSHPVDPGLPIVLWSFLEIADGPTAAACDAHRYRREYLLSFVNSFLGYESDEGLRRTFPNNRLELFLTFSTHFPLVAKAEFSSFEEMDRYLTHLRQHPIKSTASIPALRGDAVWPEFDAATPRQRIVPAELEHLCLRSDNTENALPVTLLLKVLPGTERVVASVLRNDLVTYLGDCEANSIEIDHRGNYWDLFIRCRTRRIGLLVHYVVEYLRRGRLGELTTRPDDLSADAVLQCATRLYWPPSGTLVAARIPSQSPIGSGGSQQSLRPTPSVPTLGGVGRGDSRPSSLDRRYYNLQFDLDWLFGQVRQLHRAWELQGGKGRTFERVEEQIRFLHDELNRLVDTNFHQTGYQTGSGFSRADLDSLWNILRFAEQGIRRLKNILQVLRAEFHEVTEGLQTLTTTEPHIVFGDRAGVTEVFHEAAAALFESYCGAWDFEGRQAFTALWNGVVADSNDEVDWGIRPDLYVLTLPMEFKLHVHRRLLPLAHEAGHLVIHEACHSPGDSPGRTELFDIWRNIQQRARSLCCDLKGHLEERRHDTIYFDWLSEPIERLTVLLTPEKGKLEDLDDSDDDFNETEHKHYRLNQRIAGSEILVDVLGIIAGGPAMVSTLWALLYAATDDPHCFTHPPVWLRVYLGTKALEHLGVSGEENPWMDPGAWAEAHNWPLPPDPPLWSVIEENERAADLPSLATVRVIDSCFSATQDSDILDVLARCQDRFEECSLLNEKVFLIAALLEEQGAKTKEIADWCRRYSRGFSFYEIAPDGTFEPTSVDHTNSQCLDAACRLLYNEEIVMDEPPQIIAAASMHPAIRRPVHPAGRIIHSLYYTEARSV